MSKRDDVIAEAATAEGVFDRWPSDLEALTPGQVDNFRDDMLLAVRVAVRIGTLAVGPDVARALIDGSLDERKADWDGVHRMRPEEWRYLYIRTLAALAAVALDAVMSIDDQRAKDGRTFYETTEG